MQTAKAQISLHIPAVCSGPLLSVNRIVGYYKMLQWRANAQMKLFSYAGWCKFTHFGHVWWYFFANCIPYYNNDIESLITKTCLYNFDPLKTHFQIVKLGFTGVHNIFLIFAFAKNIDYGYSLELPCWGSSSKYPQSIFAEAVLTSTHKLCFEQKYENFQFFAGEFSVYLNRHVFVIYYPVWS